MANKKHKRTKSKQNWDVYEQQTEQNPSELKRKGRSNYDDVENFEYKIGKIDEEDDEEIDEDEAFNEEDEAKYGDFFEQNEESEPVDFLDEGSVEGSEDNFSDESNEFPNDKDSNDECSMDGDSIDEIQELLQDEQESLHNEQELLQNESSDSQEELDQNSHVLDSKGSINDILDQPSDLPYKQQMDTLMTGVNDSSDNQFDSPNGDFEEGNDQFKDDSEQEDFENIELDGLLASLDQKQVSQNNKKRTIEQVAEAFEESEFNLDPKMSSSKVGFSDLLQSISTETGFGGLKKQIASLDRDSKRVKKLQVPLHPRAEEKLNRKVAYEHAKKKISKWQSIVKKNREADTIDFTQMESGPERLSNSALAAKFTAQTEMEIKIQELLEKNNLTEKKALEQEELLMNKLTKEEVEERRAELAKIRSLLFFKEMKQKKISKIKSKTYRKIRRKGLKDEEEIPLEELARIDPEAASEERLRLETQRAQERMTLRHKNKGKWAKQMLSKNEVDNETRHALNEQLERHEQLKRKIKGFDTDESEGDLSSNEDGHQTALDKLSELDQELQDHKAPEKGVFAMKFMQRSVNQQKQQVQASVNKLRQQIDTGNFTDDDLTDKSDKETDNVSSDIALGRRTFGDPAFDLEESDKVDNVDASTNVAVSSNKAYRQSAPMNISFNQNALFPIENFEEFESKDCTFTVDEQNSESKNIAENSVLNEETVGIVGGDADSDAAESDTANTQFTQDLIPQTVKYENQYQTSSDADASSNPWLADIDNVYTGKKKVASTNSKHFTSQQEKAFVKFKQQKAKMLSEQSENDVFFNGSTSIVDIVVPQVSRTSTPLLVQQDSSNSDHADSDSEHHLLLRPVAELTSKDIMSLAFANDNVEEEFHAEKLQEIESEIPQESQLLPGWGSWAGPGIKSQPPTTTNDLEAKRELAARKRKDANLKRVIINEKRIKKSEKYTLANVPHGFQTRDQYERTIRQPLGKEWNAIGSYQGKIKPQFINRPGELIQPMKLSSFKNAKKK